MSSLSERLEFHWRYSPILCGMHSTWVYTPPMSKAGVRYPWLIVLEGDGGFGGREDLCRQLCTAHLSRSLAPFYLLFVEMTLSPCSSLFSLFVERELIPWFFSLYPVSDHPQRGALAGIDKSALTALYLSLHLTRFLRTVIAFSPDIAWSPTKEAFPYWICRRFAALPVLPLQIALYFSVATELDVKLLCQILTEKQYVFCCTIQTLSESEIDGVNRLFSCLHIDVNGLFGRFSPFFFSE